MKNRPRAWDHEKQAHVEIPEPTPEQLAFNAAIHRLRMQRLIERVHRQLARKQTPGRRRRLERRATKLRRLWAEWSREALRHAA